MKFSKKQITVEVAEFIRRQIIDGEYKPGDKIMGEVDLSKKYAISRPTVREAIQQLVGMGLLEIKRGQGTFVCKTQPGDYFDTLLSTLIIDESSMKELIEYRFTHEPEITRIAAEKSTSEDITKIKDIHCRMKKEEGHTLEFSRLDLAFHCAIAHATHNKIIVKISTAIADIFEQGLFEIIDVMGYKRAIKYHAEIINYIEKHDGEGAKSAVIKILENTSQCILKDNNNK